MKKTTILITIFILILSTIVSAEIYSVDPCGQTSLVDNGATYTYGNDCMDFTVPKTGLSSNFEINNYLDDTTFQMLIQGITEESPLNDSEIEFSSLSWNVLTENGYIEWQSTDGMFRFGYIINGNTFKSVATITNYNFLFPDSVLRMKNLVKKSKETDLIEFVEPIVDDVPIDVETKIEVKPQGTFYWQDIGRGSLIEIDPVYIVDYSPVPALYIYTGYVSLDDNDVFPTQIDITSGISDNFTSTKYEVYKNTYVSRAYSWYEIADNKTSKVIALDLDVERAVHDWNSKYTRINVPSGLTNGSKITLYWKARDVSNSNLPLYAHDITGTKTYATFTSGSDSYHYTNLILNNIGTTPITNIYISDLLQAGSVEVDYDYIKVYGVDTSQGKTIVGRWSQTFDTNYDWFLMLYKTNADTNIITIEAYNSSNSLAQVKTTHSLSGTGWFNIDVNSLMDYEKNTKGLTFTQFRIYSTNNANISELYLRSVVNDTLSPTIYGCSANTTSLGCDETAYLSCYAVDDTDIDDVLFQINSVNYTTTRNVDLFKYYLSPTGNGSIIYDWQYTHALDIVGKWNKTDPNIQINYTCNAYCIENWVEDTPVCLTDDTYLSTYTDLGSCGTTYSLPAQNGTYQSCNYCSESLVVSYGVCQVNETQSVTWTDNNYYTCCAVTGLVSDCSILYYPYNITTSQSCQYFGSDLGNITCQNEPNFNVREKEYCLAHIPNQYLNETFKCISYVTELNSNEILQTNPEYRERTSTLFDFKDDPETREYFAPANALVNFYYTDKNLNPETDYILSIECSSQQRTLKSERLFQMAYEDYEFVFFRTKWLMANASYIIGGILLLFILIAILWLIYKQAV